MTSFVSDFVHQFTESIEKTISNQNKQIGNYIYNQKLLKCKTRLKTVCCNTRDDNFDPFESLNMSVVYEIDDNNMVTRNGEDTVDNSRARLIDEVLTHVFHMEVLVEKTLNNGKLFEDDEWKERNGQTIADYDEGALITERSILIDSGV